MQKHVGLTIYFKSKIYAIKLKYGGASFTKNTDRKCANQASLGFWRIDSDKLANLGNGGWIWFLK